MLAYQTACFRTQLENGQRRSIIHIERRIQQVLQLIVQLLPFVIRQLSALDFLTRNLADIRNQTVHQLDVTHFKREQRHRIPIINGNILRHRKYESRLTHGRTGSDNNKVGILPAGSHLVQFREATFKTAQTVGSRRSFLNQLIGFVNHRIDLRIILFHVLLRNLKKLAFRFLHQVVHIQRLIKSLALDIARKCNQLTRQRLLRNDTCMVFNMCRRSYPTTQLSNIERPSDLFQIPPFAKLLLHRQDIHRFLVHGKVGNSCINQLVTALIKRFGTKNLAHQRISILLDHQSTQHRFLQLRRLRLDTTIIIYRLYFCRLCIAGIFSLFSHGDIYYFTIYDLLFMTGYAPSITASFRSGRQR